MTIDSSTSAGPTTGATTTGAAESGSGTASTVADQGRHVAGTAKEETQNVAGTAAAQARSVMGDTVRQVSDQVNDQAATQRDRLSQTLRTLGDDLEQMASQQPGPESGMAVDLAREVSERVRSLGSHLEGREPGQLLDEARDFARRRPGTFLIGALAAGVVAGRLFRATADGAAAATLGPMSGDPGPTGGGVTPVPTGTSHFGTDTPVRGLPGAGHRDRRGLRPGCAGRASVAVGDGRSSAPGHAVTGSSSLDPEVGVGDVARAVVRPGGRPQPRRDRGRHQP